MTDFFKKSVFFKEINNGNVKVRFVNADRRWKVLECGGTVKDGSTSPYQKVINGGGGGGGALGFIGPIRHNDELDFKERSWWKIKGAAEE